MWARNYWLADAKNGSVHYGLQGTHSSCVLHIVQFLQADKIGASCTDLIMLRITGMHTAACGLCDEEPVETLTSQPVASLAWKPQCMSAVCYCSQQNSSACQFLSWEEKKMKKNGFLWINLLFNTAFRTFKLFLSIKRTTSNDIPPSSSLKMRCWCDWTSITH